MAGILLKTSQLLSFNMADDMDALFGSDGEDETEIRVENSDNARPITSGVLQFHTGTEEALFLFVKQNAPQGDHVAVLLAIDTFCYTRHWMMHIGDKKLKFLTDAIKKMVDLHKPKQLSAVELGSYCGYSAISIASHLDGGNGDMMFCVESDPHCVFWTQRMVDYAGMGHKVRILQHRANECSKWSAELAGRSIQLLFIDHDKREYLRDLRAIEAHGLLQTDAVVVADNVLCFNSPIADYLTFVRDPAGPFRSSELFEGTIEYATTEEERANVDGIEVSIHK